MKVISFGEISSKGFIKTNKMANDNNNSFDAPDASAGLCMWGLRGDAIVDVAVVARRLLHKYADA